MLDARFAVLNYLRTRQLAYPPEGTDFKYLLELRAEVSWAGAHQHAYERLHYAAERRWPRLRARSTKFSKATHATAHRQSSTVCLA